MASSRAPLRACVGVVLRNVSAVELRGGVISGCSSAVLLSSAHARLVARDATFANARSTIEVVRGGHLDVQRCHFDLGPNDVGLRIAADTAGAVGANQVRGGGSLWGRLEPPRSVRTDVDADLVDVVDD